METVIDGQKYRLHFRYSKTNLIDVGNGYDKYGHKLTETKRKKGERIATTAILGRYVGKDMYGANKYIDLARSTTVLRKNERFVKEEGRKQSLTHLLNDCGTAAKSGNSSIGIECLNATVALTDVYDSRKALKPQPRHRTRDDIFDYAVRGKAKKIGRSLSEDEKNEIRTSIYGAN